jgi:toxin ParE1/3/4
MREINFSPLAESDIDAALSWSAEHFGMAAQDRYFALISQAFRDLRQDPQRVGSITVPGVGAALTGDLRLYHLRHSRVHVTPATNRVKNPRHFVVYRVAGNGTLRIARLLHDSTDIPRRLIGSEND